MLSHVRFEPKPNPTEAFQEIKLGILSQCDDDIREAFSPHGFTIEPLLIQLIREVRKTNEYYGIALANAVRITSDAADRDHELTHREPETTPQTSAARTMGEENRGVFGEGIIS